MSSNWSYLITGYAFSIGLFVVYRAWIAVRRRSLEQERDQLEKAGLRLEDEA